MGQVISTGLNEKGLKSEFFAEFNKTHTQQARWPTLATIIKSTSDAENYKWLGSVPQMREWGTGRKGKGLRTESYSVKNQKYESTIEIDRDEISDDQTGQIMVRARELGARAATHKDFLLAQLLINGATAGFTAYDGKVFFATDHESGKSGSQSNKLTFDIDSRLGSDARNKIDDPEPQTLMAAYDDCIGALSGYNDDQGEIQDFGVNGIVVLTHRNNLQTWTDALKAPFLGRGPAAGGDSNLRAVPAEIMVIPQLTDVSKFYVARTSGVVKPFVLQDREPMELGSLEKDSETGFTKEKYLFGVRARYAMAYGLWEHIVSMDLT